MTTPPHECPTRMTGPSCSAMARLVAATSSANEVSGFWTATAFSPAFSRSGITLAQLEPSAHAPCTRTTLRTLSAATARWAVNAMASAIASMRSRIICASKLLRSRDRLRGPGLITDRQLANPPAGRREDRISQRRHDARSARLADSAWRLQVLYQVDLDPRRLVDAQHPVIAEVRLLDAAVLDGDLAVERGRQAEHDPALHLRANRVGVDLDAAIDRAPHVGRVDGTILVDADLDHLRHEAAEAGAKRDASRLPVGKRLAPSGSFRGELQDGLRPWVLVQQREPVRKRLLLRVGRELVDEALDDECPARDAHPAPPRCEDSGRLLPDPLDLDGADLVGLIRRALHRIRIDAVLDPGRVVALDDGRAGDAMRPGDGLALRVHARADAIVVIRAVHVVLDVFLARPDHLDGPLYVLRNLNGPHGAVVLETATEPAAQQVIVEAYLLPLQARHLHDRRLRDP